MKFLSRDDLKAHLELGEDDFDAEDLMDVADIMYEAYGSVEILTWLTFHNQRLGGIPRQLARDGKIRDVMVEARRMVKEVS